jgi:hypothetical protein
MELQSRSQIFLAQHGSNYFDHNERIPMQRLDKLRCRQINGWFLTIDLEQRFQLQLYNLVPNLVFLQICLI